MATETGFLTEHLTAFDTDEMAAVAIAMNKLVRQLQGRKLEEGDWTDLYCRIKGAPAHGWSNMPFRDYLHDGVGVEFKLMKKANPSSCMGRSIMHPAATRTIQFRDDADPNEAMEQVLGQWAAAIDAFERRVRATSSRGAADLRWGVLLWADDHSEFLYFEERLSKPDPADYYGRWRDSQHRGKPTRTLSIIERKTDRLRFSCTVPRNGAKLQPYFDVPDIKSGAHIFHPTGHNAVPIFVERADADAFQKMFPETEPEEAFRRLLSGYRPN